MTIALKITHQEGIIKQEEKPGKIKACRGSFEENISVQIPHASLPDYFLQIVITNFDDEDAKRGCRRNHVDEGYITWFPSVLSTCIEY
jgi:hypothetical protein